MNQSNRPAVDSRSGQFHETGASRPFRLLRYFLMASLGAMILAMATLSFVYERLAVRDLTRAQEHHHVALARMAANTFWPQFSDFVRTSSGLDADALRSHPETEALKQAVLKELSGTHVLKIKIYDLSGRTAFSTEAKQIGEDKSNNAGFVSARKGQAASELVHRNEFSAFEQVVENVDVVSSYIPIRRAGSGDVEAVFEIYSDISPLLRRIADTRTTVVLAATAILLGLYLVLFFIVKHADAIIKHQHLQLERDRAQLREAHDEITRSEQFHRALIDGSSDALMVLDSGGTVRYASTTSGRVLGRDEPDFLGSRLADVACEEYREGLEEWIGTAASRPGPAPSFEFEGNHPTKGRRFLTANASNLLEFPAVRGIVVNLRDTTNRKRAEMQVRHMALHDSLTGLARRDFFREQARKAIAVARRYGDVVALLYLDLDGFKEINDDLGHDAGDAVLKGVADRLRQTLRDGDTIGRYSLKEVDEHVSRFGGDEFVILLSRVRTSRDAASIGTRILRAVSMPYDVPGGRHASVTGSIGIAAFPEDGQDVDQLLKRADAAMYAAKNAGKNICRMASEP